MPKDKIKIESLENKISKYGANSSVVDMINSKFNKYEWFKDYGHLQNEVELPVEINGYRKGKRLVIPEPYSILHFLS